MQAPASRSPHTVTLQDGSFWIDGEPTFLYGGEIHYFRLDPATWERRVAQAKALGLNTIASYVPWIWHEPTAGMFDFTGATHPQRNLARFLEIVAEAGLFFLARVGPVSNAELVGEGIPPWLFEGEPALQLKRADGSFMTGMPSYRHPGFLKRVASWYDALWPVLAPHMASAGGNIPLVQLCNEIDMPTWLSRQPDHHAHVDVAFAEFAGGAQPDGRVPAWPSAPHTRWMEFYADHFARYVADLKARLPELKEPVLVNLAQWTDHEDRGRGISAPMTTMLFRDMARVTPDLVLGGDYYPRRMDYENFHDVVIATELVRMVGAPGAPVVSPELMAGCNEDRPRIYAADIGLLLHTSAGHGLNGLNLYMLSGGRNPESIGIFGDEHDWQAPIAPDGTERAACGAIRELGDLLAAHPRYAASQKVIDTHVGVYAPYFQTEYLKGEAIESLERRRVTIWQDGLLRELSLANFAYDAIDLQRMALPTDKATWIYTESWMDEATQSKLLAHVEAGHGVAFYPGLPTLGADGQACRVLADALGILPVEAHTRFVHLDGTTLPLHGAVQTYTAGPLDTVLATTDSGAPCALWRATGASGVLVVGFGMRHRFDRQIDILRGWAAKLALKPVLKVTPADAVGVVRADGDKLYIHLFNYHDEPRDVSAVVSWKGRTRAWDKITLPRRSAAYHVLEG